MEKFRTMFFLANNVAASISPEYRFDICSEKKRGRNPGKVTNQLRSKATKTSTDN